MAFSNAVNATQEGVQYISSVGVWQGSGGTAAGNVLTSNGPGVRPTFQTAGGGVGKWVLLQSTVTTGSQTAINFTSVISNAYQKYVLLLTFIRENGGTGILVMETSSDNGSTYFTTGYSAGTNYNDFNSNTITNVNSTSNMLAIPATSGTSGQVWITNDNIGAAMYLTSNLVINGGSNLPILANGIGQSLPGNTINAFRLRWNDGGVFAAFESGTVSLYGILETGGGNAGNLVWFDITGTSASMQTNAGYVADNSGLVTLTLPATANIGDSITINGKGSGGWSIAQNTGQQIVFLGNSTTAGVSGSLSSTGRYNSVYLQCITSGSSTIWTAKADGNLTVV
ncbi:MAG: hypothetical protein V4509_01935 [Patescibacteria group bacterium]